MESPNNFFLSCVKAISRIWLQRGRLRCRCCLFYFTNHYMFTHEIMLANGRFVFRNTERNEQNCSLTSVSRYLLILYIDFVHLHFQAWKLSCLG